MNRQIRYMKSILFGSATTALIVALSWSALPPHRLAHADEPAENLLKNGSMEEASVDDSSLPANWEKGNDIEGVKYLWNAGVKEEKKIGWLEIAKSAKRYFPIAAWEQTFDRVSDDPALTVTVKVRANKVTKAIVDAIFLDSDDQPLQHEWLIYIGPKKDGGAPFTHAWKPYSGTVKIPSECKRIKIALQDYGPGNVAFDDVVAVYEKDVTKVKDAVGLDASSEDASKQADITEATTDIFASNATTKAAPVETNNPALTPSSPTPTDTPSATTTPPVTSQSQGGYVTAGGQSLSMPAPSTNPALPGFNPPQNFPNNAFNQNQITTQQQIYTQAARSQPSRMNSNQAIQNLPNQYGFQANQPANVVTYGPAQDYFANVEADQIITQMVPSTQERFIDGHRVSATTFEKIYRTSDGKQFSSEEAAGTHARTLKLTKQYHNEPDSVAKVQIREDLLGAVKSEYDQLRAERLKEIEELTKKLEEVKANLDKRDQVKDKIIEKRVEQLLGVDQLYQWDTSSQPNMTPPDWRPASSNSRGQQLAPGQPLDYRLVNPEQLMSHGLAPGQPPQYNPVSPTTYRPNSVHAEQPTGPAFTPTQPGR